VEALVVDGSGWRGDDLGVLAGRLLFSVQDELFVRLHQRGFDDLVPRHGVALAYLRPEGIRATDLARLSGQVKQVVGVIVDDLERLGYVERRPDPADRRAKLIVPTKRGRGQMRAADAIMADIMDRHEHALGRQEFRRFLASFRDVVERQRAIANDAGRMGKIHDSK
jgi:DNA-binding MarR family transcriptional regulator